jgi:phosphoribosylanthranilate isomerase
MLIKICGITTPEDAIACFKAGADMIGLVHYPPSPRHVDATEICEIVNAVRGRQKGPPMHIALVVVDQYPKLPHATHQLIRYLQNYGDKKLKCSDPFQSPIHVVKDYDMFTRLLDSTPPQAEYYCLEMSKGTLPGGNGAAWDWSVARPFCERYQTLIAGGITPDNVAEVIRQANPYGIDVSSGVESSPGVKDIDKVNRLMDAVRQAPCSTHC